jgi:hypothetical protein
MTSSNFVGCGTGRSAGFSPLENPADVNAGLMKTIDKAGSVAHQAAAGDEIPKWVHRENGMARGQRHELFTPVAEEWVSFNDLV